MDDALRMAFSACNFILRFLFDKKGIIEVEWIHKISPNTQIIYDLASEIVSLFMTFVPIVKTFPMILTNNI